MSSLGLYGGYSEKIKWGMREMYQGKYIYCFIEGIVSEPIELMGIGKYGKVYFINHEDITVAISDTPVKMYDPTKENALTHERIIQQLMKHYNLVPCNFGNVFKSKDDIITFMKDACEYIKDNLENVRDKMEVGLRIFWKKPAFAEEIETKEIIEFRDAVQKASDAESYYSKMELGKMVEEQVNIRRQFYIDNIYEPLEEKSDDAKLNEPVNPRMILNAAFLIHKDKEQDFDKLVEALVKKYEDNLEVSYTGPWPPYNFTNIEPAD